MPTRMHYQPNVAKPEPAPVPLADWPRSRLCGRIWALRRALEELQVQASVDGQGAIEGTGALKVALITYEGALREHDRKAGQPFAAAVNDPVASARVRVADLNRKECDVGLSGSDHEELARLVRSIAVTGTEALKAGAR